MPTTIPLISAIPSPTDSRAQFSDKAFTMVSELNPVITAMNAQATENNAAAVAAASSASAAVSAKTAAEAAASTAASTAGAEEWVNGATYTQGEVVWSPFSLLSYRRRTNGTSTVDPAFDRENWEPLTRDGVGEVVVLPSGTTAARLYATHCFNGAASVLTLPADPKVGEWVAIAFTAAPVSGQTIDRNGKLIMGLAENLTLNVQQAFRLVYTGSAKGWGIATANVTAVIDNEAAMSGLFVSKAGDTITGEVIIRPPSGQANFSGGTDDADAANQAALLIAGYAFPATANAAERRVAAIGMNTSGSTPGHRGGSLKFVTKDDNSNTLRERLSIDHTGAVLALSGPLGYGLGAGGTVTQTTSKSTTVTLNKPYGQITMHNAALAAGARVRFNIVNSFITPNDLVVVCIRYPGSGQYEAWVSQIGTGNCDIEVRNNTASSLSDGVVVTFAVIKGALA